MFIYTEGTDISLLHANILINVSNHVENFGKLFEMTEGEILWLNILNNIEKIEKLFQNWRGETSTFHSVPWPLTY